MEEEFVQAQGIRFSVSKDAKEVGRAYLYLLNNDLNKEPFGLLEDVFVDNNYRGSGIGNELIARVITKAKECNCYKLIATSRNDGTRKQVHDWYQRLGFKDYGTEFRINL